MKKILIIMFIIINYGLNAQIKDNYFKIAAENNPGLQAKYKEFEAALQKSPQVSTLPDPSISFGYFISPVETRVGPQIAKFSLTQMLPWFGTLKAQGDAAALMADAKYQVFLDYRNKLFYQVAASYYPLYEIKKLKLIEQENINILQTYKNIAYSRFENGAGSMVDVLRVDIMLKDAETNLNILNMKEKPLLTTFNKLLNREENVEVLVNDSLELEIPPSNFSKDSLLSYNPVLKELDLKIKASEANKYAAYKQGLPKLGIGLDYVIVGKRTDITMPENGKDVLMPMITVSIPIFRAKYDASIKEAQIMKESYLLQKDEYTNSLISSYETSLFDVRQHQELLKLYGQQILESNQILNLLFTAYSNTGKDFEEVLRIQQQLLKYEKMKTTAIAQYFIAIAKLDYITSKSR